MLQPFFRRGRVFGGCPVTVFLRGRRIDDARNVATDAKDELDTSFMGARAGFKALGDDIKDAAVDDDRYSSGRASL